MGVFKLFSSNSSSIYKNKYGDEIDTSSDNFVPQDNYVIGDPQPHRFDVLSVYFESGLTIANINYPDCQNFGGEKILIYQGDVVDEINSAKILDPHFLEVGLAPIARISPSENGNRLLKQILKGYV